jgi:flagellar biosynthetic protein FliR
VPVSGVGQIKGILALLIYAGLGGHLMLLRGLADSLHALPPTLAPDLGVGAGRVALAVGGLFRAAVQAAAPVMVTLLLVNVALAILSRAVPQVNAMMVAFPVTIGVGLLMLGAAVPLLGHLLAGWVHALPADVEQIIDGFRPVPATP